ncbi:hypothetical protein BX661DRAFT_132017, partial [Kickxella alabastrina]|uniref:uncharacterized protein n=1 Tax=Kickxella alabastrina TaxID=61397 RepID=UPI002220E03A
ASQQQAQGSGKILISNLDFNVTEADLRDLFSQVGPVSRATLNFGPTGKSKGTGEVHFRNASHAKVALDKYNNVTLDNRPMRIEVVFNPSAVVPPMMMPTMMAAP